MPFALSIAWRLLLAVGLIVSPIIGLASEGGCAHGQPTSHAESMPDCADMAGMTAATAHGKTAPAQGKPGHAGCFSNACCVGGAVGMAGISLAIVAPPAREPLALLRRTQQPSPAHALLLRPPIA